MALMCTGIAQNSKLLPKRPTERIFSTYCDVVSYLLQSYNIDHVGFETDTKNLRVTQQFIKTPIETCKLLYAKVIRCSQVYDNNILI